MEMELATLFDGSDPSDRKTFINHPSIVDSPPTEPEFEGVTR